MDLRRVKSAVAVAVLLIFLVYFYINIEEFRPLLYMSWLFLIPIALVNVAGVFTNGLFTKFILEPFGKSISVIEAFYVSVISSIGNFFATAGTGFGIRAIYLKKKHGLPYSEFISTLSGNYVLVFLVNSLVGLLALYQLKDEYSGQYTALVIAFSVMFFVSLTLSVFKIPLPDIDKTENSRRSSFVKSVYRVLYGWNSISKNRRLMAKLLGLTVVNLILTFLMYWAIIESLSLSATFSALLLFSVLGSLSIFINITPANLGVKEAVYIFSSSVLGFSVNEILLIALVERSVQFIVLLVLWLFSSRAKNRIGISDNSAKSA